MIVRSMHLEHYRCFEDFDIDFDDHLTVLVGANGAGKTVVLDALGVFLQWSGHPKKRGIISCAMPAADLAIGSNPKNIVYRLEVRAPGEAGDVSEQLDFFFKKAENSQRSSLRSRTPTAFRRIKGLLDAEKPVFVAYMAGRFIPDNEPVLANNIYKPSDHSAFENTFKRTVDYAATLTWFNHVDAEEARAMRDSGKRTEMPELKAVREALSKALLGQYERPRMRVSPGSRPELIIYRKGTDLAYKVSQLSDGYRAMLALIMDLARRMAEAHSDDDDPLGESPLHSPAIALIDEVELHLHPSWQQTVLPTLMDIFPHTQFIVSTHSPQVLTSIPARHIRILSEGKAHTVTEQTQGAEASRLLKHVFGVEQRPEHLPIVQALHRYAKLVYDEQWDTREAEKLRKKLVEHYGPLNPKLMELDLHIENGKWERGL